MLWIGGGTGGLRVGLKGHEEHWNLPMWYGWPTAAHGYQDTHTAIPASWGGDARDGGCQLGAAQNNTVPFFKSLRKQGKQVSGSVMGTSCRIA